MLADVATRRIPRTKATVDLLLERYLDQFDSTETIRSLEPAKERIRSCI
jgi:hypothetical protein